MDWFTDAEVKEAIEALPEQFRMAVLLADVEGFAYKEIAEILDIPIGTVMSRLHRGRKSLQKQLFEFAAARGLTRRPDGDRRRRAASPRWPRQRAEPVTVGAGPAPPGPRPRPRDPTWRRAPAPAE